MKVNGDLKAGQVLNGNKKLIEIHNGI